MATMLAGMLEKLPGEGGKIKKWSGWRDLNPRSPDPQSGALAGLGHTPTQDEADLFGNVIEQAEEGVGFSLDLPGEFQGLAVGAGPSFSVKLLRQAHAGSGYGHLFVAQ
jgi:hypothetical protein